MPLEFQTALPPHVFRIPVQETPPLPRNSKMPPVVWYGYFLESPIGRCWKTRGQIYKQILIKKYITRNSLKAFFCAEEGIKVWTALSLFALNCKQSLPTPFCEFDMTLCPYRHPHIRIRPIMRGITNINPQETCLSETLTYAFATLQDVRMTFCALVHKWTIQMV